MFFHRFVEEKGINGESANEKARVNYRAKEHSGDKTVMKCKSGDLKTRLQNFIQPSHI